jgi:hypothetical protein
MIIVIIIVIIIIVIIIIIIVVVVVVVVVAVVYIFCFILNTYLQFVLLKMICHQSYVSKLSAPPPFRCD